jgi:bifunctional enzyme Fae/Hps
MQNGGNKNNFSPARIILTILAVVFLINPFLGAILLIAGIIFIKKNPEKFKAIMAKAQISSLLIQQQAQDESGLDKTSLDDIVTGLTDVTGANIQKEKLFSGAFTGNIGIKRLEKNKKYLQIALNGSLDDAINIISQLPSSEKIILEAGTPLIKIFGDNAIKTIRQMAPYSYIVADVKTSDLAECDVEICTAAGANAVTCLGVAPIETIDRFIEACGQLGVDSMVDMMNVPSAIIILKKLKKLPSVVILHRGVDETEFSKEKQIPYYQIKQIKGSYNIMVSVAGGDTPNEIQSAIFNSADIVVVWKNFMQCNNDISSLAGSFLKDIR